MLMKPVQKLRLVKATSRVAEYDVVQTDDVKNHRKLSESNQSHVARRVERQIHRSGASYRSGQCDLLDCKSIGCASPKAISDHLQSRWYEEGP
jgi:hypothetical protein